MKVEILNSAKGLVEIFIPNRDKYVEELLSDKKISLDEYLYIVNGKEV